MKNLTLAPEPPGLNWENGRCFGCIEIRDVTAVGEITRNDTAVPIRVCALCLRHIEEWHQMELERGSRARLALAPPC